MGDVIKEMDKGRKNGKDKSSDPDADIDFTKTEDNERKVGDKGAPKAEKKMDHPFCYSNETSDLRLLVEGRPLYVSRVVLSLVSPVLRSMLSMKGYEDNVELTLSGKKYDHMVEFLCCIYPDILKPITEDNVEMMLDLADDFQVTRLIDRCEDFMVSEVEKVAPPPEPKKIVRYLSLAETYNLGELLKASFEAAAKTPSDLLENVPAFGELPSVTTTSVFIRRLKLLEKCGKAIRCKQRAVQNHCSLYHKGENHGDRLCTKCFAQLGQHTIAELKYM